MEYSVCIRQIIPTQLVVSGTTRIRPSPWASCSGRSQRRSTSLSGTCGADRNWFRGSYRDVRSGLLFRLSLKKIIRRNATSATEASRSHERTQATGNHLSSRLRLVVAASGHSNWRCNLGSAQGARHSPDAPNTLPRRAASSFCQDNMRHSADTTTPSRASGVQFPFSSSPSFFHLVFCFCIGVIMIMTQN